MIFIKIVRRILIVVICLLIVSIIVSYYSSEKYKQKKYLKINSNEVGEVSFKYLSPSSFNGDGIAIYVYEMAYNDMIEIRKRSNWHELPTDIEQKIGISYIEQDITFKFPESGFYLLYDKQNRRYVTIEEYFNSSPYRTFNYILAILDFQNNVFVYFEEDT
ncbi:MAG: hypothetical protein HFI49_02570 [Bacilli bacterium]|nr:hypothetical protein [Bacilli bacterium]